jgi:hypothetical protein
MADLEILKLGINPKISNDISCIRSQILSFTNVNLQILGKREFGLPPSNPSLVLYRPYAVSMSTLPYN